MCDSCTSTWPCTEILQESYCTCDHSLKHRKTSFCLVSISFQCVFLGFMTLFVSALIYMTRKIVSEMTYNVSMGTLNPTIPYLSDLHGCI